MNGVVGIFRVATIIRTSHTTVLEHMFFFILKSSKFLMEENNMTKVIVNITSVCLMNKEESTDLQTLFAGFSL